MRLIQPVLKTLRKYFPLFKSEYIVLGIETSCDDTACAIVSSNREVLGEFVYSQQKEVLRNGGIIPSIAKDLHARRIKTVVDTALRNARRSVQDVDAIAVTTKPGLVMSLLVGINYAKMLSKAFKKPFLPIHHMEAHALTVRLTNKDVQYPYLTLLISGGHCLLAIVHSVDKFSVLGKSLDDAPGEIFDKVARRLKLHNLPKYHNCSGGFAIEDCAKTGNSMAFDIRVPCLHYAHCDFSFCGLKSRVHGIVAEEEERYGIEGDAVLPNADDICASFQFTVMKHLAMRLQRAMEFIALKELLPEENRFLVVSGGAACNSYFRNAFNIVCKEQGYRMHVPPAKYCSDNGVMIAWNGIERYEAGTGILSYREVDNVIAEYRCPLGEDLRAEIQKANIKCKWVKLRELHTNIEKVSSYEKTSDRDSKITEKCKNDVQNTEVVEQLSSQ